MKVLLLKDGQISKSVAKYEGELSIVFEVDVDIRPALKTFQALFYKKNDDKTPLR